MRRHLRFELRRLETGQKTAALGVKFKVVLYWRPWLEYPRGTGLYSCASGKQKKSGPVNLSYVGARNVKTIPEQVAKRTFLIIVIKTGAFTP